MEFFKATKPWGQNNFIWHWIRKKSIYYTSILQSDIIFHHFSMRENSTQISSTNNCIRTKKFLAQKLNFFLFPKGRFRSGPHYCQRTNFKIKLHIWSFALIQHVIKYSYGIENFSTNVPTSGKFFGTKLQVVLA